MRLVFAIQLLSTLAMFGLIWFVQIVHYPLHLLVGEREFTRYEAVHATRTGYIAAPLMLAELLTSAVLLRPGWRPLSVTTRGAWVGFALVLLLWLSTVLVQIPLHDRLHKAHSRPAIVRLIRTNWLRTAAWTLRAALVLLWACTGLVSGT